MFGRRQKKVLREHEAQIKQRFERNERVGQKIYAQIADLRKVPRENLPDAAFMLLMAAKRQSELTRDAIRERTASRCEADDSVLGDLATYLAEGAACALRDHVTDVQTIFEVFSETSPEVRFTISQQDGVSLVAAMIREQRLEGIVEGLRLAGLLNEAPRAAAR